jgi:hypothetical protein
MSLAAGTVVTTYVIVGTNAKTVGVGGSADPVTRFNGYLIE